MNLLAINNPFIAAYLQSDFLGKCIFGGLFFLSALCWTVLVHKSWLYYQVRKTSEEFSKLFFEKDPLSIQYVKPVRDSFLEVPHPFFEIYKTLKQKTLQLISKNHFFSQNADGALCEADFHLIESQIQSTVNKQSKILEKNLYVLSTIATLGPFLGLLGTVWGILMTFSQLQTRGMSFSNSAMLGGLSMALATTVIGLVIAIPALAGFNYLKNAIREYRKDMEEFSQMLLAAVELQHRKPDYAPKNSPVP
jgi:biopolymer transport protein TolQ